MGSSSQDRSPTAGAAARDHSLAPRETHTPAPWEYVNAERGGHHFRFIRAPNTIVENNRGPSYAREVFSDEDYPEKDADGALIAAAPDMLAALKTALAGLEIADRGATATALTVRQAIAKALSDGSEARTGGEAT